jgi:hypothetical protein
MPPPSPCRIRKAISMSILDAVAHRADPAVKRKIAAM